MTPEPIGKDQTKIIKKSTGHLKQIYSTIFLSFCFFGSTWFNFYPLDKFQIL